MNETIEKILVRVEDRVGWITFNNPEQRNAISVEMWNRIGTAADELATNDAVRVIVLTGAGGKAFASGADISQFSSRRANAEQADEYKLAGDRARYALRAAEKPVIAAIEGFCLGGGLAIAMTADIRLASENSAFGVPAARLGLAYGPDDVARLVELVGSAAASELLFTARRIDAAEAHRIGLVNVTTERGNAAALAAAMAAEIAVNAPLSVRAGKLAIRKATASAMSEGARLLAAIRSCFDSEDYQEGIRAFLEKRTPNFRGV